MIDVVRLTRRTERLALPERRDIIGSSLSDMERDLAACAESREAVVPLTHADIGYFPPPDSALDAFAAAIGRGIDPFTPGRGDREARAKVAPAISRMLGVDIDPERQLALTAGTQSGLFCSLAALVQSGDCVLLVDPDYLASERVLRFLGADVESVSLATNSTGAELDLDHVRDSLRAGVRLLLLSHPNNPTGAVYSKATIDRLAGLIAEYDAMVVVDELYARLVYDNRSLEHLVSRPGMLQRTVTLLGTSKTESMAGFRIGCVVGPAPVIDAIEDIERATALRAPAYAQHALASWLTEDDTFVSDRVARYQVLRDMTVARLAVRDYVKLSPPAATAYVFPSVSGLGMSDLAVARALVERAGVLVKPGVTFGRAGLGSFRMCFAQNETLWPEVLDRIVGTLDELAEQA